MWTYEYGSVQDEKAVPCSLMVRSGKDTCPGESTPSRPLPRGHWSRRLLQPTVPCLSPGTQRKPGWELLPPLFLWPGQGGDPRVEHGAARPLEGSACCAAGVCPPLSNVCSEKDGACCHAKADGAFPSACPFGPLLWSVWPVPEGIVEIAPASTRANSVLS